MKENLEFYLLLLTDIKKRVRQGQIKAHLSANVEMLATYWDIGKMIHERQQLEGWGKGFISKLSIDLKNELPEEKGFSERNIQFIIQFYLEYSNKELNTKRPVSQLEATSLKDIIIELAQQKNEIVHVPLAQLEQQDIEHQLLLFTGWAHHIILIQKVKVLNTRFWYMQECLKNGWSRDTLVSMIKTRLHERQGKAATNFDFTLPPLQSELAKQTLKDPYIFDFLTLETEFSERELETELVKHVEKFLIELGTGFAFVGRQYYLNISDNDFHLDLLFYHLKMRCFVVIDLKKGAFKPEYAGKMNFYCSAVDDQLRHPTDMATIGLILCQEKNKLFAEYALRDINKPIGISEYELTRMLPNDLKSSLPSVEDIENELSKKLDNDDL